VGEHGICLDETDVASVFVEEHVEPHTPVADNVDAIQVSRGSAVKDELAHVLADEAPGVQASAAMFYAFKDRWVRRRLP